MDFLNPSFWQFVAVIAGIYGIMALGLYVQYSLAGLPNFGTIVGEVEVRASLVRRTHHAAGFDFE